MPQGFQQKAENLFLVALFLVSPAPKLVIFLKSFVFPIRVIYDACQFCIQTQIPSKQRVQHSYAIWLGLIINVVLARNPSNR